jgi:DNA-binding NtrC family response regulator
MAKKKRILVFEDFDSIANILIKTLEKKDVEILYVKTIEKALAELNGTSISILITDNDIKNNAAEKLIRYMRDTTSYLFTPVVLLITGTKEQYIDKLVDYNIACYLSKPFDINLFNSVIDRFR